jgi:hypothetical protein
MYKEKKRRIEDRIVNIYQPYVKTDGEADITPSFLIFYLLFSALLRTTFL